MHTHLQYDLGGLCYVLLEDVIRPGWVPEYACTAATQRKGTADERCIVGEAGFKGNGGAAACDGIRGKFGLGEIRRKNENWGRRAEQRNTYNRRGVQRLEGHRIPLWHVRCRGNPLVPRQGIFRDACELVEGEFDGALCGKLVEKYDKQAWVR